MPDTGISAPDAEELYRRYKAILAGRTDEWEAALAGRWRDYEHILAKHGEALRNGLAKDISVLKLRRPDDFPVAGGKYITEAQFSADNRIWEWQAAEFRRLGIWPAKRGEAIEVANRKWDSSRTVGRGMVEEGTLAGGAAISEAGRKLRPVVPRGKLDDANAAAEEAGEYEDGNANSWLDNIIFGLEVAAHQASAHVVDALSGPNSADEIDDAAELFEPPMQRMELSFVTHPRAQYRATIAAAGLAMGADDFVYYLPANARAEASESGFAASQHSKIRTVAEWQEERQKLDAQRPGSFIFTTGFHPGDKGYLFPIPAEIAEAAVAVERQERQSWLDRLRRAG